MRRPRPGRILAAGITALAVAAAACAPLPATGPRLATGDGPGQSGPTGTGTEESGDHPEWLPPETDLDWTPCGQRGPGEPPEGITLGCGMAGQSPVVRVTSTATPEEAAPLVVVAGPETPASILATRLASTSTDLVDSRPIVIVDHRGRTDAAATCLSFPARRTLDSLADRGVDPGSPELRGALADTAQSCTDQLQSRELDYGATGAAEDLETLRQQWQVPGLAVLGLGTGARTALAFSTAHPDRLAVLALDSPAPHDGDQESQARTALDGSDAALRLWSAACTRAECGPGDADQKIADVADALDRAADPGARIPAALLSDVIRSALSDLAGASAPDAAAGDIILGDLSTAEPGDLPGSVRERAEQLAGSSLSYIAGCSDLSQRVPVNRIEELESEWSGTPPFGPVLAAQLSGCSTWPVPAATPVELSPTVPVLLSAGIADPIGGAAMIEPAAGRLTAAGATDVRTVTWGAPGSGVVLHSPCGRSALLAFLEDPASAEASAACPS